MGRNVDLMFSLARKSRRRGVKIECWYPFHLAVASCVAHTFAVMSSAACSTFAERFLQKSCYANKCEHTVLDSLMAVVIKAHTICLLGDFDDNMKRESRLKGAEGDICGRWDADSVEIRALFVGGASRIPFDWKHKFYHTSAQVICHCISLMPRTEGIPDINHPSGLFKKKCQHCAHELVLLPLHTLVMVAFQLAQRGCAEEDLFGILACLLCLLWSGADPLLTSELSAAVLFGTDRNTGCTHEALDPLQLAERLPRGHLDARWPTALCTRWRLLIHLLRLSQKAWQLNCIQNTSLTLDFERYIAFPPEHDELPDVMDFDALEDGMEPDGSESDDESVDGDIRHCRDCDNTNYFQGCHGLRDLWAATQAELLTYRRLRDGDTWLSSNFIMQEVLDSLDGGHGIRVGLIECDLLREYCDCGAPVNARDEDCACVDEVCKDYFSNLEEWERTTYVHCPKKWRIAEEEDDDDEDEYYSEDEDDFDEGGEEVGDDDDDDEM